MPESITAQPSSTARPGEIDTARIVLEITRLLEARELAAQARHSQWISLAEAAGAFGYSVSRFYHVYRSLGLTPSRASKRKLRFHRQDIESVLRNRQRPPRGRPRHGRKSGN